MNSVPQNSVQKAYRRRSSACGGSARLVELPEVVLIMIEPDITPNAAASKYDDRGFKPARRCAMGMAQDEQTRFETSSAKANIQRFISVSDFARIQRMLGRVDSWISSIQEPRKGVHRVLQDGTANLFRLACGPVDFRQGISRRRMANRFCKCCYLFSRMSSLAMK
jgi:hypothetical protein